MIKNYIVSVPGRAVPLCVAADGFRQGDFAGGSVSFLMGIEIVAIFPVVDCVIEANRLPDFPGLSQFKVPDVSHALPGGVTYLPEPVRGLDALSPPSSVTHNHWGNSAVWPLLVGLAVGGLAGVVMTTIHAGLW